MLGWDEKREIRRGPEETFGENKFVILLMVMTSQVYTSVRTDQITHFIMQFLILKFYLSKVVKKKMRQIWGRGRKRERGSNRESYRDSM